MLSRSPLGSHGFYDTATRHPKAMESRGAAVPSLASADLSAADATASDGYASLLRRDFAANGQTTADVSRFSGECSASNVQTPT